MMGILCLEMVVLRIVKYNMDFNVSLLQFSLLLSVSMWD
jgi:hypothetical protein